MQRRAYVETDVNMAHTGGVAAWFFDIDYWGVCGQGRSVREALAALSAEAAVGADMEVAERISGDEQAFERDRKPATPTERAATAEILSASRRRTLDLLAAADERVLDFDDPDRVLPAWARWRTVRQMAWHVADTESRYYLPCLGMSSRDRESDVITELTVSGERVLDAVWTMPSDVVRVDRGEVWTTTKVLRRLAWHERSELLTMERLVTAAADRLAG